MKPTQQLHDLGQSIWLDNIRRGMLADGTLQRYILEFSVSGLTSNPTIFDQAIRNSHDYDDAIRAELGSGITGEKLFFDLALEDITAAADLFRPIHTATNGLDGWVSLEVSPKLAYDAEATLAAAIDLHSRANRPNVFIKIPGTPDGLAAIEEAIVAGVPVNVTLLFSSRQYLAAAEAYLRGLERRLEAGLNLFVPSVASVFISRWDKAVARDTPPSLHNILGIAMAKQTYAAFRSVILWPRYARLANAGARPQRLLWASTGTKDPDVSDVLYVKELQAPFTINTMPEQTLLNFADHGEIGDLLPADGGNAESVLYGFERARVDVFDLAQRLQREGAESFVQSWDALMACIEARSSELLVGAR